LWQFIVLRHATTANRTTTSITAAHATARGHN
jgi:hypothetical protein